MANVDPIVKAYLSERGKAGAKKRWQGKSKKERVAHTKMMAQKRLKKRVSTRPTACD